MTRRTCLRALGGTAAAQFARAAGGQPAADFEELFDGESLAGWTAVGGEPGIWHVAGGMLAARPGKNWLSTNRAFGDFDLRLDYRLERAGNSGVLLRAPHRGDPSYEGLEVQLLDDGARIYRQLRPEQHAGSIYGVIAARPGFAKPAGAWNRMAIRLEGGSVRVVLNGSCVVDARLDGQPPAVRLRHPGLARSRGFIGLQAHETPVWFRNLAIRSVG